jgi:alkanesulfonate monooxygenase SsuD/methylene tetrahydromethanopterin reductase-like flavin-dependent oxidoreductase (luciferase family)
MEAWIVLAPSPPHLCVAWRAHLVQGEGGYIVEGWTGLAALAATTTRIRFDTLVP